MLTTRINFNKVLSVYERVTCYSGYFLTRNYGNIPVLKQYLRREGLSSKISFRFCSSAKVSPLLQDNDSSFNVDTKSERNIGDELLQGIDLEELVGNDEVLLKKLKVIILEMDIMRQDGHGIPNKISLEKWKELLLAPNRSQRFKLLSFLFKNQKKKENDLMKKERKKKLTEARQEELNKKKEENSHIHYGFGGSTIFLRIYDTTIDAVMNQKLIRAMQFGQNLVLDCSYDKHMNFKEASLCAKQMAILFAENRKDDDPFNLHFCNAHQDMKTMTKLSKQIPTLYDDDFPLNITDKSYLDVFPKERLVYLTPHCRQELKCFSHDDIYIIGGMVDKTCNEQLSLGIAKREGLRMAKLPLDKYLLWHIGSKSLTLNQMLLILLEMKTSGDWTKAFEHVPRRKLLREDVINNKPTKGPSLYRQRLRNFNKI